MIAKTPLGVSFFDARYGGIYQGRAAFACGKTQTGKTVLSFQFLRQGLSQDERGLMLSTRQASDLTICAESLGLPISAAVDAEELFLLEYSDFVFGMDRADPSRLPPDGFNELKEIIEAHAIRRVVIDTIVPWVAIRDPDRLGQHVLSFVRAFDRLGATTLMTLPKPVSPMAHKLRKVLEQIIPVCVYLSPGPGEDRMLFQVTKYLGEKKPGPPVEYEIVNEQGLAEASSAPATPARAAPSAGNQGGRWTKPSAPAESSTLSRESPRIRFASAVPVVHPEEDPGAETPAAPPPTS